MKLLARLVPASVVPVMALAPAAQADPHTHDGFLLRLALGVGYDGLSIESDDFDVGLNGFGAGVSIAIGGMVTENLAINADIFGASAIEPTLSMNGTDIGSAQDSSVSLGGLGVGVTYYFMPVNLYVAASVGFASSTIKLDGESFGTDSGFAINAMVGKEFWVGEEWGIGIAGQFLFADIPTTSDDATANYMGFNLMFSATFN